MIRRAAADEHDRLTQISFASKRHWKYPESYFDIWKNELTISPGYIAANDVFVTETSGIVTAYYSLTTLLEPLKTTVTTLPAGLWLEHMFVDPEHIEKGTGTRLFQHAVNFSATLGVSSFHILADPHSLGFYLRMGCLYLDDYPSTIDGRTTPYLQYSLKESVRVEGISYSLLKNEEQSRIQGLWEKLRRHHEQRSVYHKNHFASYTFEQRMQLLNKRDEIRIVHAERGGRTIGYCIVSITGNKGEIDSLFVDELERNRGIGNKLMEMAMQWFLHRKVSPVTIEVAHGNEEAIPFYARHGFRERMVVLTRRL